jgi:hypothetical protein
MPDNSIMFAKIFAAIVMAIILIVLLLHLQIPNWLFEIIRQGPAERRVYALTPDLVIAKCGTPLRDATETYTHSSNVAMLFRRMDYKGGSDKVELNFSGSEMNSTPGRWVLSSMIDLATHSRYTTGKSKLAALPCLTK